VRGELIPLSQMTVDHHQTLQQNRVGRLFTE
jgi:hypothetical protein